MTLTQARLREVLIADSEGRFFWRDDRGSRAKAGDQAGSLGHNGYWSIGIDGVRHYEHRLVWLWHHGHLPDGAIDHADGNKWNNRLSNLRLATASQNVANARLNQKSTSMSKGVSWNARLGKWHAYIGVSGSRRHLGFHFDKRDAERAYSEAATLYFGEFARPIGEGRAA